jgi:tRNA threonylcarbamoyladenosine biosynthesis protein TsaE
VNTTSTYIIANEDEWSAFADTLLKQYPHVRIFLLFGDLGAGKTTFVKSICKALHVRDTVQSPTFSIVNEYCTEAGNRIVHMDLYRIQTAAELYELGLEDYLYSGDYCFIEWPELLPASFVEKNISVYIEHGVNNTRTVKLILK